MPRSKEDFMEFDCDTLMSEVQNINKRIKELEPKCAPQDVSDTTTPEPTKYDELKEYQDLLEELSNICRAMGEKRCGGRQNVVHNILLVSKNKGWPINVILTNGKKYTGIAELPSEDGTWVFRRMNIIDRVNFNEKEVASLNWVK